MLKRITLFCMLIGCLLAVLPMAYAQDQLPDLIPVVIDANQGHIEVRNIGNATAGASNLSVICSTYRIDARKSRPCAAGLHLPNYTEIQCAGLPYPRFAARQKLCDSTVWPQCTTA